MSTTMDHSCELCSEFAGRQSRFHSLYGNRLPSRITAQTPNFAVLPSLGQLGDAHLMVVSRNHETSTSTVPTEHRQEMFDLIERVRRAFQQQFVNKYLMFENGDPEGQGQMGCSISHMHVHLVGFECRMPDLYAKVRDLGGEPFPRGLPGLVGSNRAYSYFEVPSGDGLLVGRRLPSQTLRKLVAKATGSPRWDWQEVGVEEQLVKLVNRRTSTIASYG
jgi:diadenosine tetraphosphate (Ap4A) HIT family hydrolase